MNTKVYINKIEWCLRFVFKYLRRKRGTYETLFKNIDNC